MMKRPTLFLSSTVYDFGDLRSALKDYLELRGCRVLASEFTDFTRPLDEHSYQACLNTIEQADLFVLFIGRRVGGWYDQQMQISITRAEFRHAYKLAQQRRIRILCFVRSDVWEHRQSVRDLEKALRDDPELSDQQRERYAKYPTMAMDNANAIISFIDEVTKNNETAKAVKGQGVAPIANWIWPFSTFSQVREAIDPLVLNGLPVADAAGRKALEEQLYVLLQKAVPQASKSLVNPVSSVLKLRNALNLNSSDLTRKIQVPADRWNTLVFLLTLSSKAQPDVSAVTSHLGSGLLLAYDPKSGTFEQTPEYDLLVRVVDQGNLLQKTSATDMRELFQHGRQATTEGDRVVPCHLLVMWLHGLMRWVEFIACAKALARSLSGKPLVQPTVIPTTPVIDQEETLAAEFVSIEEIRKFVSE
ncbi:DUF4062 domain-containing protein (plasmid) [Rhizobium sp. B230/85]|uniref:DUF4062 domain-containing protein n=1 Tax=unclassified Rhizobium TaxID=2613769 RepID=UPI001ADCA1D2|nr:MULTISPECIES: DUF4062 domain-containing protein [unclassified Rhizobium]MBO9136682.1 DUF4062 domain-containing protein [Rhizobium sp. B209b/85]QXZ99807.1 DUF4062 domain-containing protein [Rhizobium sp. B230/85]